MNEIEIDKEFNGDFLELSKLIFSWNLIKVNSKIECNKLAEKLLPKLYENQNNNKIRRIIESELSLTYGLYKTEYNSERLSQEIINWWNE